MEIGKEGKKIERGIRKQCDAGEVQVGAKGMEGKDEWGRRGEEKRGRKGRDKGI